MFILSENVYPLWIICNHNLNPCISHESAVTEQT